MNPWRRAVFMALTVAMWALAYRLAHGEALDVRRVFNRPDEAITVGLSFSRPHLRKTKARDFKDEMYCPAGAPCRVYINPGDVVVLEVNGSRRSFVGSAGR